jgi:hypothetical protein
MNAPILSASLLALGALVLPRVAAAEVNQPIEIIDRPRTLPASQLELSLQLQLQHAPGVAPAGSTNVTTVGFGGGYGITSELEARLGYAFGLDPSSGKGPLSIGGAYSLVSAPLFTAAADAFTGYDLAGENLLPLQVGVEAQLKIGSQIALFTPGHQLSIGLSGDNPIGLHLPVGIGFQLAPKVFVDAQTEIAYIAMRGGGTRVFGADFIPVRLEGFYSVSSAFDLGVWLADDLKSAGDFFQVGVLGRLFL